jgi:hypothetical protein
MATPLPQARGLQLDNSKDACTPMMAMIPLLQEQQRQLDDCASSTTGEMSLQQGHCNKGKICHPNDNKDACASKATLPS